MSAASRPTPEQIAEARRFLIDWEAYEFERSAESSKAIETLLAATEPPTDDEVVAAIYAEREVRTDRRKSIDGGYFRAIVFIVRHFLGPVKP